MTPASVSSASSASPSTCPTDVYHFFAGVDMNYPASWNAMCPSEPADLSTCPACTPSRGDRCLKADTCGVTDRGSTANSRGATCLTRRRRPFTAAWKDAVGLSVDRRWRRAADSTGCTGEYCGVRLVP